MLVSVTLSWLFHLTFDTNLEMVRRTIEASPVSMSVSVPSLARGMSWGQTLRASYELS